MKLLSDRQGFTIVELLIVVVIIAILAAITIISYNGIQTRANNSAADALVNNFTKKLHAYYTLKGSYPATTTSVVNDLKTYPESTLGTGAVNIGTPDATTGKTTLKVELCGAGAGVKLTKFDYSTKALATTPVLVGVTANPCSVASA